MTGPNAEFMAELAAQVKAAEAADAEPVSVTITDLDADARDALPVPVRDMLEQTAAEDRSGFAYHLAIVAIHHGLDDDAVASVLDASPVVRDKYQPTPGNPDRRTVEIARVIGNARAVAQPLPAVHAVTMPAAATTDNDEVNPYLAALIDWPTLWTRTREPEWLIEPLLARGRIHSFYAKHKTKKSLLMLWLAVMAATGRLALRQGPGRPIHTLYVDHEMTEDDLQDRLADMGFGPGDDLSHLHYSLLPSTEPLTTRAGGRELYAAAAAVNAEHVVLDTVSRVIDGPENDSDTFRALYRHTMAPLKRAGVTVSRLDHTGHNGDHQRGSSAKGDDPDVLWSVTRTATGYALKSTARMAWIPQRVDLGLSADPLGFTLVERGYSEKAREIAGKLDALGIPVEAGEQAVRDRAKDAGITLGKQAELRDAITYRRTRGHLSLIDGGGES